jgi:lysozyme
MLTDRGYELIRKWEGYLRPLNDGTGRVRPYLCPANVATIGWGSTRYFSYNGFSASVQGRVKMSDDPITRERAEECFRGELHQNEEAFDRLTIVRVHPWMRDAIVSFIYNCGEGAYRGSTLRRVINSGQFDKVPRELAKWRMGGGRVLLGLERRRRSEAVLFMEGVRRLQSGETSTPSIPEPKPAPRPAPVPVPQNAPKGWWRSVVDWILK